MGRTGDKAQQPEMKTMSNITLEHVETVQNWEKETTTYWYWISTKDDPAHDGMYAIRDQNGDLDLTLLDSNGEKVTSDSAWVEDVLSTAAAIRERG